MYTWDCQLLSRMYTKHTQNWKIVACFQQVSRYLDLKQLEKCISNCMKNVLIKRIGHIYELGLELCKNVQIQGRKCAESSQTFLTNQKRNMKEGDFFCVWRKKSFQSPCTFLGTIIGPDQLPPIISIIYNYKCHLNKSIFDNVDYRAQMIRDIQLRKMQIEK